MRIGQITNCCTAKLFYGFTGTRTAGFSEPLPTKEELERELTRVAENGNAMVIAFTNSDQTDANKLLREVGFKRTRSASKPQHPETKLILWWKPLHEATSA